MIVKGVIPRSGLESIKVQRLTHKVFEELKDTFFVGCKLKPFGEYELVHKKCPCSTGMD